MLSWGIVVKAATTQHLLSGFLTMIFFGLGTVPALFLPGLSASLLSSRARFLGERVAAVSVMIMGVINEYRHTGIEAVMLEEIYRITPLRGYVGAEISWILEDNFEMNRIMSRLASEPYKVYRIYGKSL